jgi:hypothetical protein
MSNIMAAVRGHKMNQLSRGAGHPVIASSHNQILIRNTSGGNLSRFAVLGLASPPISPSTNLSAFQNTLALDGAVPATGTHDGRFVILDEPILNGKLGLATVSGVAICQVSVATAGQQYADISDGKTAYLAAADSGAARILWIESGTGTKWALIDIGAGGGGTGISLAKVQATPIVGEAVYSVKDCDQSGTVSGDAYQAKIFHSPAHLTADLIEFAPILVINQIVPVATISGSKVIMLTFLYVGTAGSIYYDTTGERLQAVFGG